MRVTFITEHYPPDPGGVATSSKRLAGALTAAAHDVQVLTFDSSRPLESGDYVDVVRDGDIAVQRVGPFFVNHSDVATKPLAQRLRAMFRRRACDQMVRLAREFEPDAVLAFYVLNAGFVARFVAAEIGRPYFIGVRGNDIGQDVFNTERFAAVVWTLERASAVACVNEHLKRRVLAVAPNLESRTVVIANAVTVDASPREKQQSRDRIQLATGWAKNDLVLVFIGTLREKKGVVTLLGALESIGDELPIRLLVVGPEIGSLEHQLCGASWERLVAQRRVYCTGQVAREEVEAWACGGDVVIMPSVDDGLANGLLEGMAMGLCPIGSSVFRDVIRHGENGLLFAQSDPNELAALLRRVLLDRQLVRTLGAAAREYVRQHHQPAVEAARYVELMVGEPS